MQFYNFLNRLREKVNLLFSFSTGEMQLSPAAVISLYMYAFLLFSTAHGFNITEILAKHDQFSTFNLYLSLTRLAAEINRRNTITVLVLNNAAMDDILDKHYSLFTIKNILSFHVLADYFGAKKLRQLNKGTTVTSTMFQATGEAPGTSGYVNITRLKGGKIGFAPEDNNNRFSANLVKSVLEKPYKISVMQISHVISSPYAEAPASGPTDVNITALMAKQGCKAFAELLTVTGADGTFRLNVETGLTAFCPNDKIIEAFMPKYKNLSKDGKMSVLLYHGVPVYNTLGMLRSSNGVINTLASGGSNKYDFTVQNNGEDVTLETEVVTAKITGTMYVEEPLSVFKVDKVLLPPELFKAAVKKSDNKSNDGDAQGPGSDDEDPSDQEIGDRNVAVRKSGAWLVAMILTLLCACI